MDTKVTDFTATLYNGQCFQPAFKLDRIQLEKIGCRNIESETSTSIQMVSLYIAKRVKIR